MDFSWTLFAIKKLSINTMPVIYYREKLLKLFDKIFLETGDARARIERCSVQIYNIKLAAAMSSEVPVEVKERWSHIWDELNVKEALLDYENSVIESSIRRTISRKPNKSMEKYLHFILEEFYRVIAN